MNLIIVKGGKVYSPTYLGERDIVIIGKYIVAVGSFNEADFKFLGLNVSVLDAGECYVVPGFIDQHVHALGAGGEGGPLFRTPPIEVDEVVNSGVTSLIGLLGTDGYTRSLKDLLMKVRQLNAEGISTWMYTGSYQVPPPTITGSVANDIILINEIIGVKTSISDHRSSHPSINELRKLASEARVAGIISGKAGIVHIHVGDEPSGLTPIYEIIEGTLIPIEQFTPTHLNRNEWLLDQAVEFGRKGGYVDITSCVTPELGFRKAVKGSTAIKYLISKGVPVDRVTMSSDAQGSLPVFNERGELIKTGVSKISTLLAEFRDLIINEGLSIGDAVKVVSTNVARHLKLPGKGVIDVGSDADVVVLTKDLSIKYVLASGKLMT